MTRPPSSGSSTRTTCQAGSGESFDRLGCKQQAYIVTHAQKSWDQTTHKELDDDAL